MIERYTRPELGQVWSEENRLAAWLRVELAVCEAWAEEGIIPANDWRAIEERASFEVEAVKERELVTDHDVAAFVDVVANSVGEAGRWIHYGLTSSDVLDTALALQIREAGRFILPASEAYRDALRRRALECADVITVGRTHGVHAEPTSFGLRLAGYAAEAARNCERLQRAFAQVEVGKLSGAVGTYSATSPQLERRVMGSLALGVETVSTQVVPRDRHAELLSAIAITGTGLERFATEIRHLQRTEVREVEEPFKEGQKGSSAMPHKRDPILAERIAGLARVLRGNAQAALESVALWHERDISHSSVERIVLPDSTILLDYMLAKATTLVEGMTVNAGRMRINLDCTHGALYSQRALTTLVASGMSRDDAYRIVQESARRAWDEGKPFRELFAAATDLSDEQLDELFSEEHFLRSVPEILKRLDDY